MISMIQILKTAIKENASDIHITEGAPPVLRIDGDIIHLNSEVLTKENTKELCYSIITDEQKKDFELNQDIDFSFSLGKESRFRGHIYYQKKSITACFRLIPLAIPKLEDLNLPPVINELGKKPYGLILVTGPTGSGKTTTLASLLDEINNRRKGHILTIEDPIEFIYNHKQCIVSQREIGIDSPNFQSSLKAALRVDPDVCLLGELRDKETIETALHIAGTGHLTFGTLHTNNTFQSIDRLTGVFSGEETNLVRSQLAQVLQGIVSQRLLPTIDGKGRALAIEVLLFPPAIRNLIKEGKQNQIYSIMQIQKASGIITLNQSLLQLCLDNRISEDVAIEASYEPNELIHLLKKNQHNYKKVS